jgi:acetylornithine/succinyldiaminopimelate/putrescine aminotransferase
MMATESAASVFQPGNHASTFGGNPLAMAASLATLDTIMNGGVLDNVKKVGPYFMKRLHELKKTRPVMKDIRGRGLIIGVEMTIEGADIVKKCMDKGLLINCTGGNVLRFVPPLIITEKDVDVAIDVLSEVLKNK